MERYAQVTHAVTTAAQRAAVQASLAQAGQLLAPVASESGGTAARLVAGWAQLPDEAVIRMVGALQQSTPLDQVLQSYGIDAARQVQQALVRGLVVGQGAAPLARAVEHALGITRARAETLVRTETLRASSSAMLAAYRESGVLRGWRWSASLSDRTCSSCLANHNRVFPLDTPMRRHVQCRCSPAPVLIDEPDDNGAESGEAWLARQSVESQEKVLGRQGAADFRARNVRLEDFRKLTRDPVWGDAYVDGGIGHARKAATAAGRAPTQWASAPERKPGQRSKATDATPVTISEKSADTGGSAIPTETHPLNSAVRRDANGIWGGDELPVMEWEAPEARVVLPQSIGDATSSKASVLRLARSKQAQMLQKRPGTETLLASLDELLPGWTHMGQEPGDAEVWRVIFPGEGHQNQLVFGPDRAGSWNVITAHPLRAKQQELLQAQSWMREQEDE